LVALASGCESSGKGGERQPCNSDGTCNAGLTCQIGLCAKTMGNAGSSGAGGGAAGTGAAGSKGGAAGNGAAGASGGAAGTGEAGSSGGAAGGGAAGSAGGAAGNGVAGSAGGAAGGGGAGAAGGTGGMCTNYFPAILDCVYDSRPDTTASCGSCLEFNSNLAETACACLTGAAQTNCRALLDCMAPGLFSCVVPETVLGIPFPLPDDCFCSDEKCSQGADGPCAAQFEAVAGSTDPAEVMKQLNDKSTTVYQAVFEAIAWKRAQGCSLYCSCVH
jgi:hypothetical protein